LYQTFTFKKKKDNYYKTIF